MGRVFRGEEESPRREALVQMDVFRNSSAYRSGCLKVRGGEGRREEGGGEMGLLESHSFPPEIRNRLVIERGKVIRIAMTH